MTIKDAIGKAKFYACSSYLTSEKVYEITQPYHKGDNKLFVQVCRVIASQGIDVVDECFENAYKIIFNIDHEGETSCTTTIETLILAVKKWIDSAVATRKGRLMQEGYVFGIISSQSETFNR